MTSILHTLERDYGHGQQQESYCITLSENVYCGVRLGGMGCRKFNGTN
jgi:hypothetical protein